MKQHLRVAPAVAEVRLLRFPIWSLGCVLMIMQDQPAAAALQGTHRRSDPPVLPPIWQLPFDMLIGYNPEGKWEANRGAPASAAECSGNIWGGLCLQLVPVHL
jgi:hypothetical protein